MALPGSHMHSCDLMVVLDERAQGFQRVDEAANMPSTCSFKLGVPCLGAGRAQTFPSRSDDFSEGGKTHVCRADLTREKDISAASLLRVLFGMFSRLLNS